MKGEKEQHDTAGRWGEGRGRDGRGGEERRGEDRNGGGSVETASLKGGGLQPLLLAWVAVFVSDALINIALMTSINTLRTQRTYCTLGETSTHPKFSPVAASLTILGV